MRPMAAAGRFYPSDEGELEEMVKKFLGNVETDRQMTNVVAPHAGYPYSGQTAAYSYGKLIKADIYVIVGPCHYNATSQPAATDQDWQTPLGPVEVDERFIDLLEGVVVDDRPHARDHAIEVQLPFLQVIDRDFSVVPLAFGQQDLQEAKKLARNLDSAADKIEEEVAVVASSDLTHFQPDDRLREMDEEIYNKILSMEPDEFYRQAAQGSVCGFGPIVTAMLSRAVTRAELLDYSTSADATGDKSSAVGYVSIGFK